VTVAPARVAASVVLTLILDGPPSLAAGSPAGDAPGSTTCASDSDCALVNVPAATELAGGPCCPACAQYVARNAAWAARQPVCDARARGACPISCAEGPRPYAACVAHACTLVRRPAEVVCSTSADCIVAPERVPMHAVGACEVVCGAYVARNRDMANWRDSMWGDTNFTGHCPAGCAVAPTFSAACAAGQCVLPAARERDAGP
jgi:hypothetical protein